MAPVGSALPSSTSAVLPPASFAPITPQPMTVASKKAVPRPSASSRRDQEGAGIQVTTRLLDVDPSMRPMSRNFAVSASWPDERMGRLVRSEIRFLRYLNAVTKARSFSKSPPSTAAGSSMRQCAVIG